MSGLASVVRFFLPLLLLLGFLSYIIGTIPKLFNRCQCFITDTNLVWCVNIFKISLKCKETVKAHGNKPN